MANDRKRPATTAAAVSAVVLAFAATWAVLDRSEHRPRWAVVEATQVAVVGRPFEVRITLDRSVEATELYCNLHRANAERRGWGFLANAGPSRPAAGGGTYSFVFTVPDKPDTAYVFALVFLSPTGEWKDGTRAVATELVPVGSAAAGGESAGLGRLAIRHYPTAAGSAAARTASERPRALRRPPAWVHPLLAALLLAAACAAARAARTGPWRRPGSSGERTIWLLFAAVLGASALVEVSGFAGEVASLGRRWAQGAQVYGLRQPVQKLIMAATAAGSLGLFFLFIRAARRPGSHRALWWAAIGLADYLALSFVGVLSFHAVDVVRGRAWLGVPLFDAVRAAGVVAALAAGLVAARRGGRDPLT